MSSEEIWDVVVVGAGPAGALAARQLARRGATVLLVDRATFPRSKVCGCCLGGQALATLGRVGLHDLTARCGAVPLTSLRLAAPGCEATLTLPTGVALSRTRFDAALVEEAVAAGAVFRPNTDARLGPIVDGSRCVDLPQGRVRARLVLAADGLGGRLLESAWPVRGGKFPTCRTGKDGNLESCRPRGVGRIGAGVVASEAPHFYEPGTIFMACARSGYVGLVRLEDGRLDIAAAFDVSAVRRAGSPGRLAETILREAGLPKVPELADLSWRGTPPLTRRPRRLGAARVLALGDAAGYVEPFTGEGIAWALASAVAVAPIAERAVRRWDDSLLATWEATHRRTIVHRQTLCRAVARLLRSPFFVRAALRLLGRLPGLASPVLRHLNAPRERS